MITSRKELKEWILADRARQPIAHPVLSALTFSESWSVRNYLMILRHYEYHLNTFRQNRAKFISSRTIWGGGNFRVFCNGLVMVFSSLAKIMLENRHANIS